MKKNYKLEVDFTKLPGHIAIVMDGNGRWAKKRLLPVKAGHNAGGQNLRKISEELNRLGFKCLTVYAFSTENWKRSQEEVDDLMDLMRVYIQQFIDDKGNNAKIVTIGNLERLDLDLREKLEYLSRLTENNDGLILNIALNYGGRDEICRAVKMISQKVAAGELSAADITEEVISNNLDTARLPDPDIFIRTGGDSRVSNFMPWQTTYSEFFFVDKFWPDFSVSDILEIVGLYQRRERRFGGR